MKNATTSERLKYLMDIKRLKQVDILEMAKPFCKKYGIKLGKADLSQYISGKVEPGQNKLTILGLTLNVSEAWLMGYDVPMERASPTLTDTCLKSLPLPAAVPEDKVYTELREIYTTLNDNGKEELLKHGRLLVKSGEYTDFSALKHA